jgi:hypothetical protein
VACFQQIIRVSRIRLLVDHIAAAELVGGLRGAVVSDEAGLDRGDVGAGRRALAVIHGVDVEILEGVQAVGPAGDVVIATPDLDHVDRIITAAVPPGMRAAELADQRLDPGVHLAGLEVWPAGEVCRSG